MPFVASLAAFFYLNWRSLAGYPARDWPGDINEVERGTTAAHVDAIDGCRPPGTTALNFTAQVPMLDTALLRFCP